LGQSIGGAIRDLLLTALNPPESPPTYRSYSDAAGRHYWRDPDRPDWAEDPYDPWRGERDPYHRYAESEPLQHIYRPTGWPVSIAAGLRAGSWWLRRGVGPCPTVAAVLLGIAVALLARTVGPLAEDALTLAEVAGQLSGLAHLAGSGAEKLMK
jgi:hypothetical protein